MKLKDGMMVRGELKGVKIERGMIRKEGEKYYFCQDLVEGAPCCDRGEFKYSWCISTDGGIYIDCNDCKLKNLSDDIENILEGEIIYNKTGERKILGICGGAIFISIKADFTIAAPPVTMEELKSFGYKIKLEEEEIPEEKITIEGEEYSVSYLKKAIEDSKAKRIALTN